MSSRAPTCGWHSPATPPASCSTRCGWPAASLALAVGLTACCLGPGQVDHLQGRLYIDRMDPSSLSHDEQLYRFAPSAPHRSCEALNDSILPRLPVWSPEL